jgi:hypothetical protein
VPEPERWITAKDRPNLRELFAGALAKRTMGSVSIATVTLLTFRIVSAFLPLVAAQLAAASDPSPAELAPIAHRSSRSR